MENKRLGLAISRIHREAQSFGGTIVPTSKINRSDREILVRANWLQEIIRGWYMLIRPDLRPGDTSAWYANFWEFVHLYLHEKYKDFYCLGAENSLDLHVGVTTIPKQVIAIIKKGGGKRVDLPFNTSILTYQDAKNFPLEQAIIQGIRVMSLPYAICKVAPTYFQKNALDIQIALHLIKDLQELVYVIATYNFVRAAERIIGAFEAMKEEKKARFIQEKLKSIGMNLKSVNPFETPPPPQNVFIKSPYQGRIINLWNTFRITIIENFPKVSRKVKNKKKYLDAIEEIYAKDAYNSLSIEGYQVNPDLIERVLNNHWNPDLHPRDLNERDALAARGYYEAFLEVKKAIKKILNGENPGNVLRKELQKWFEMLFNSFVKAGSFKPQELLGYRKSQVYIRNSRHVPLPKEALFDAMNTFFDCLENEEVPAVKAILGHFIFVYIHPYMDGNGRLGRFIMNAMFASGGYPWTIIEVKNRTEYFEALEKASSEGDILPFVRFVMHEMKKSVS